MTESAADAAVATMLDIGPPHEEGSEDAAEVEGTEGQEPESIDDLPDWAQEEIRKLRRENAGKRVVAREQARKTAVDKQPTEASQQAITAAEERGRQAARMENGIRLAGAEVKASLAGVLTGEQIAYIIDDLNLSRFVDDDGEVDSEAVLALREKYSSILGKKPVQRVSHGQRQNATTAKSNADLFGEWLGTSG